MKNTTFALGVIALGLVGLFAFAPAASAVSISPVKFELNVNPGDVIENIVRIYNDQTSPVTVTINVDNFAPAGEAGQVVIDETGEASSFSIKEWVTLDPVSFILEPRSSKPVAFKITVPQNAEPGGHYGSILASVSPGGVEGGVGVAQRIGALLLLDVSGEVNEKLVVSDFGAPSFTEYGPIDLSIRFKNDGTVHLKPRGFVTITNMFGNEVGQLDLPQSNVLPGSARKFELPWGVKYMYGKYTANLNAIYGTNNDSLAAVAEFWVIPWKIVGGVGLVILIVLIGIFRGRHRISMALSVLRKGEMPDSK